MVKTFRGFRALSVLLLASLVASGCSSGSSHRRRVSVVVTPAFSVADAPVHMRLAGLPGSTVVVVGLHSVDGDKISWTSSATFRSDPSGVVDLDSASASGVSASYTGVDGMGLIWSLRPSAKDIAAGRLFYETRGTTRTFTLEARVHGHRVGSTSFGRADTAGPLRQRKLTLSSSGLSGTFVWSPTQRGRHPAVLLFGGSGGGPPDSLTAKSLASHGYPVLALTYFRGEPDLPDALNRIPLEYFAHALTWLGQQPQVDRRRLVIWGASRGSEAALLVGAYFPQLVHAVVAGVPSNVALPSYPVGGSAGWTVHGKDVPFTFEFNNPHPTDQPAAVIAVEKIRGPVLMDCGGLDATWHSCAYAHAILQRLKVHHHPYADVLKEFPAAGHSVGAFFPYDPYADHSSATFSDDEKALEKVWPETLSFLSKASA